MNDVDDAIELRERQNALLLRIIKHDNTPADVISEAEECITMNNKEITQLKGIE